MKLEASRSGRKWNRGEIAKILPYEGGWLLLKEISFVRDGTEIEARTYFPSPICEGHFKDRLVVPGALLGEAMKQTAAFLILVKNPTSGLPLVKREEFFYKSLLLPDEPVIIKVKLAAKKLQFYFFEGRIEKDGKTIMKGEIVGVGSENE